MGNRWTYLNGYFCIGGFGIYEIYTTPPSTLAPGSYTLTETITDTESYGSFSTSATVSNAQIHEMSTLLHLLYPQLSPSHRGLAQQLIWEHLQTPIPEAQNDPSAYYTAYFNFNTLGAPPGLSISVVATGGDSFEIEATGTPTTTGTYVFAPIAVLTNSGDTLSGALTDATENSLTVNVVDPLTNGSAIPSCTMKKLNRHS